MKNLNDWQPIAPGQCALCGQQHTQDDDDLSLENLKHSFEELYGEVYALTERVEGIANELHDLSAILRTLSLADRLNALEHSKSKSSE